MLTPLDIQNAVFHRSFRGYDEQEVDDFLDRVVVEYEQLYRENLEMKEELAGYRQRIQEIDRMRADLEKQLHLIEQNANEIKANAEAKAALILEQARAEGAKMVQEVRDQLRFELAKLEELRRQEKLFRMQFRTLLQTYLKILEASENGSSDMPGAHSSELPEEVSEVAVAHDVSEDGKS